MITSRTGTKQSYAHALLDILSRPGLPNVLSTKWISEQMHTPWRNVSKHVLILDDVQRAVANLGWRYVSRKGRLGSTFERHRIITGDDSSTTADHDGAGAGGSACGLAVTAVTAKHAMAA